MSRTRINLNRDWRFCRGDVAGASRIDFHDSQWQRVGLPHTFDLPYFRTPEFYVGVGWYRKHFHRAGGRRAFIEFEGAFQVAELFVNGHRVGEHRGGYTGFYFDITEFALAGENVLAVRVDNNWNPQLSPRAGEHIFSGGLYRDVWLVETEPLHIAWQGTCITTPHVSREFATVHVRTEVHNDSDEDKICSMDVLLLDPDGVRITQTRATRDIPAHASVEFEHTTSPIANPKLWHPDTPHFYEIETRVFEGEMPVDTERTSFGLRWFEWTADRGFFLNGEHLYLRGANAHQDHAGWGIAITQMACERDIRLIKEAGFNFVRGAHYPHHPAFADACDRLGLIFWPEHCFWGKGGYGPDGYWNASAYPVNESDFAPFEAHCKQTLAELIRINRNHPSIVVWSLTNEAFFTYNLERAKKLMRALAELSHQLDPTRPAAIGGAQRGDVDKLADIAGYNGDGARLFINPGVPNMVSEYGAISKPHDAYDPFFGELQAERFPWRSGQAIWAAFDYGSIAGKQGLKGILQHNRLPKRSWYWYRNEYRMIPPPEWPAQGTPARLALHADKTVIQGTDATDDVQLVVTVLDATGRHISNSPPVTLTIESGPGEFPTGRSITFEADSDIAIVDGQAAIAFRSYHGGESVIRARSPGLEIATISIFTNGEPQFVAGETAIVSDRPYHPPPISEAAKKAMASAVNVALNRPCGASGEIQDHPARFANDGDARTGWSFDTAPATWWADLEGFYQLASLRLLFHEAANIRFLVELSTDAQAWTTAIDRSETQNTRAERQDIFPPGAVARFVRIRFTHLPTGRRGTLCEVEIFGILSVR